MAAIFRFCDLAGGPLVPAAGTLLQGLLADGRRVVLRADSEEQVETINSGLWTYSQSAFIPHGSARDGNVDRQPIFLTDKDENPNGADTLVCLGAQESPLAPGMALCCFLFDRNHQDVRQDARDLWRRLRQGGGNLSYSEWAGREWREKDTR